MTVDPQQLPLRDIHLPTPVSWWPPAPGWWILLGLLIALVWLGLWAWKQRKAVKQSLKSLTQARFETLRDTYRRDRDPRRLVQEISVLLRRASMSLLPRERSAGLTGEAWLGFLDRMVDGTEFSEGVGRVLLDAPYKAHPDFDAEALLALCQNWIESLPEKVGAVPDSPKKELVTARSIISCSERTSK